MTLLIACATFLACLALIWTPIVVYVEWRLKAIRRDLYHAGWDIDAVLARLSKHEEQGH
jgi:hypothetical protein